MLIGEVARRSGVSARMLRHYDRIGLVSPTARTSGHYRQYAEVDVERLLHVESLRSLGLSLAEVADALDSEAFASADLVERLAERARAQQSAATELVSRLDRIRASDPRDVADALRVIALIRGFDSVSASGRQRLALTLEKGDERDTAVLIEALLREDEPNVAGAVLWSLAMIGDPAVPVLARELTSAHARRRHRALKALLKIGTPRALASVARQTTHPDPRVRARANIVGSMSGDIAVVAALVAQVAAGELDMEASDALEALASREGFTGELVRASTAVMAMTDADGRRRLVGMLACIPGPDVESVLQTLAADPEFSVAIAARAHLGVRTERR
ncbi:MerR family transcriptional regulator [Microbacterium sp. NPDC087592]|uniref:MerR family transcriptional regulator n=1 Tax=Microbacterium sp. NPDC087592 TaxID=3364193 RepID=UPI0037F18878